MDTRFLSTFGITNKRDVPPLLLLSPPPAKSYFLCTLTCLLDSNSHLIPTLMAASAWVLQMWPALICKSMLWWVAWCIVFCHYHASTCVSNPFIPRGECYSTVHYWKHASTHAFHLELTLYFVLLSATWLSSFWHIWCSRSGICQSLLFN